MKLIEKIKEKQADPVKGSPVTLAFIGDSVTQGCFELYKTGEESFQTEFRVEDGYHNKLRQLLQLCYPSVPINMIHAGISGDNALTGLERLERDVLAYQPDLTVVSFGLNDCCAGMERLPKYEEALDTIFTRLDKVGGEAIFLTPNAMPHEVSPEETDTFTRSAFARMIETANQTLPKFMEAARGVCANRGVPVCDCYRKWEILRQSGVDITRLLANRINHPVEKMHWMFAVSLFEMIMGM